MGIGMSSTELGLKKYPPAAGTKLETSEKLWDTASVAAREQ
jgi:hypothetical protein